MRHFKEKKYVEQKEKIIQVIVESKTKQAVNNNLMKLYPNETVHVIYKRIQPLIKNLPGRQKRIRELKITYYEKTQKMSKKVLTSDV